MDAVISYLLEWLPAATMTIIAVAVICIVCWKAFKYHNSIQQTKKTLDELPCEANKNVLIHHMSYSLKRNQTFYANNYKNNEHLS
jgi:L-lactate permease